MAVILLSVTVSTLSQVAGLVPYQELVAWLQGSWLGSGGLLSNPFTLFWTLIIPAVFILAYRRIIAPLRAVTKLLEDGLAALSAAADNASMDRRSALAAL